MKITNYELFMVKPRWLFLKISTDEGFFGWGEPIVEGKAAAVKAAVGEYMTYLIGKDPLRIEQHWQAMYRANFYRGGPILMSAISGIDQALWDIKGKYYNIPVHEMLGGSCRDKLRVYRWIAGDRPGGVLEQAKEALTQGYTAIKMNATDEMHYIDSFKKVEESVSRVASIRQELGYDLDVALDFHGRVHKGMAKVLAKELEPYHPMFIEEPVMPQNNEALKEIASSTTIPIATGERMFSRWEFKNLFESGYVSIVQPDLSHAGGISECKKIATMAEAYDVAIAPHCPLGPIALASCIQVDCCSPNALIQEQSLGIHYNEGNELLHYLKDDSLLQYENGYVNVPKGAGLGITVDEEAVREAADKGHDWKNPVWYNDDGTIAEW